MRFLKILGGIVVALVVLVGLLFGVARMSDGPLAILPGGPLQSGELVTAPVDDWGFAKSIDEIEMQLVEDDISRTTWILVESGRAYIPCSMSFPPGKDWYVRADANGDAVVRIEGKRYPVHLTRVKDEVMRSSLKEIGAAKYSGGPPRGGDVWFFELEPRPS